MPGPRRSQPEFAVTDVEGIVRRRFGRNHDKPCNRPEILTCAKWECQSAGHCLAPKPMGFEIFGMKVECDPLMAPDEIEFHHPDGRVDRFKIES